MSKASELSPKFSRGCQPISEGNWYDDVPASVKTGGKKAKKSGGKGVSQDVSWQRGFLRCGLAKGFPNMWVGKGFFHYVSWQRGFSRCELACSRGGKS